jgi:hypothetical protein
MKFDRAGKLITSFGNGMFVFPHGMHIDRDGNIWIVDGQPPGAAQKTAQPSDTTSSSSVQTEKSCSGSVRRGSPGPMRRTSTSRPT